MTQKDKKEIGLRLPWDLYEKIKNKAAEARTNVTQFIVATLEDAMNAPTVERRLDGIEERLSRLDSIEERLSRVEGRFTGLPGIQRNIFILKQRLARLEIIGHWAAEEEFPEKPEDVEKEQD